MRGPGEDSFDGTLFHDLPTIHDSKVFCDPTRDAKVVSYDQQCHA
jgi:hypothetical protein